MSTHPLLSTVPLQCKQLGSADSIMCCAHDRPAQPSMHSMHSHQMTHSWTNNIDCVQAVRSRMQQAATQRGSAQYRCPQLVATSCEHPDISLKGATMPPSEAPAQCLYPSCTE